MKIIIEIELGNAAMQTPVDVCNALHLVADKLAFDSQIDERTLHTIRDDNGNRVGNLHAEVS